MIYQRGKRSKLEGWLSERDGLNASKKTSKQLLRETPLFSKALCTALSIRLVTNKCLWNTEWSRLMDQGSCPCPLLRKGTTGDEGWKKLRRESMLSSTSKSSRCERDPGRVNSVSISITHICVIFLEHPKELGFIDYYLGSFPGNFLDMGQEILK